MKKSKALIKSITKTSEWFGHLVENLRAIISTKLFNANVEKIECKWLIGKEIEEAIKDKDRSEIYGKKLNQALSEAIGLSEREIYRCRQFYNMYPAENFEKVVNKIPELNWKFITNSLLPAGERKPTKMKEYISIRIDEDNKTLFIKSKYKNFKIVYYD